MCNFINYDIYNDLSSLYIIPIIYNIQKNNYININLLYLIFMINTLSLEFKQSNVIIGTSLVCFNNIISYHNLGNINPKKTNLFKLVSSKFNYFLLYLLLYFLFYLMYYLIYNNKLIQY
jgi:hypothetical protein